MYKYNLKSSHKGDKRNGEYRDCLVCGEKFWVQANLIKIGKGKYHKKECYDKSKQISKKCSVCGDNFSVQSYRDANRCRKCYCATTTWGYIPPRDNQRAWQFLRKQVLFRDGNICQICGKGEDLRGHHIKQWSKFPEYRMESTNVITVCRNCDYKLIMNRESEWESYFNFNLATRGIIQDEIFERGWKAYS